jgi:ethanolamine utilization protein EutS
VQGVEKKQRVIQEYVPGKQVTLLHIIASPQPTIYRNLGLEENGVEAIGILTITPGEAVIIAADVATKSAEVQIGFLDRFGGALVIFGDVASIEAAVAGVQAMFTEVLRFSVAEITKS